MAEALGFQLAFSKREWEAFGIKDGQITADDFIRVGASFYKPAPPNKLERPRVKTLMVDLIIHAVDGNAIFDSFLERNIPAKFPQAKAEIEDVPWSKEVRRKPFFFSWFHDAKNALF